MLSHARFDVGDGGSILMWRDPWVDGLPLNQVVDARCALYLGKGDDCLLKEVVDGTSWAVPRSRLLKPLADFLDTRCKPKGGVDSLSLAGKQTVKLKDC